MMLQFAEMTSSSNFLMLFCFSCQLQLLVQVFCQYHCQFWSYKNFLLLTRSLVSVLLNIWRLERVRDTKPGKNVSNKVLLNAAKCRGYSFYPFSVIKGKPTGGSKIVPPPIQIRVKSQYLFEILHTSRTLNNNKNVVNSGCLEKPLQRRLPLFC